MLERSGPLQSCTSYAVEAGRLCADDRVDVVDDERDGECGDGFGACCCPDVAVSPWVAAVLDACDDVPYSPFDSCWRVEAVVLYGVDADRVGGVAAGAAVAACVGS